jgi:hypothetical protein
MLAGCPYSRDGNLCIYCSYFNILYVARMSPDLTPLWCLRAQLNQRLCRQSTLDMACRLCKPSKKPVSFHPSWRRMKRATVAYVTLGSSC